ncbi:hypothetical protein [Lactococcus kimchii]|uniref:hypothetical protein n=1 Tax=Lactococcus sp. S-13 TaxID=2507158 RepID=UPI001023B0BD|nr:hypothetical protein [Lactococcus sp. S-13]RZI47851.1 hypothetical protein EQJ87_11305 [Lactococcus sp. S-13]
MLTEKELEEKIGNLIHYVGNRELGGDDSSEELTSIISGAKKELQVRLGMIEPGSILCKFIKNPPRNPKEKPTDYRGLLYYHEKNLQKLIEEHSEPEYEDIFGRMKPAKIATKEDIISNYNDTLKRFSEVYNNYKDGKQIKYGNFSSFTCEPTKIDVNSFKSHHVCERVIVMRASANNIYPHNALGQLEYEVFDIVLEENIIECITFDEWMIKYPKYSLAFKEYEESITQVKIIKSTSDKKVYNDEELEIINIMDKISSEIDKDRNQS